MENNIMKYNYLVWDHKTPDGCCVLEHILNVTRKKAMKRGQSVIESFPGDACFNMDPDFPRNIRLADNIGNHSSMAVISKQLMEFIKSKNPISVEFLPVSIINHKGRVESNEYYIIHPLVVQDCIDLEKTDIDWSALNPELISFWDGEMVLDTERMDDSLLFFRLKYEPSMIFVRRDLATTLYDEGFTGLYLDELRNYNT